MLKTMKLTLMVLVMSFMHTGIASIINDLENNRDRVDADGWVSVSTEELAINKVDFDVAGRTEYKIVISYNSNSVFTATPTMVGLSSLTFKTSSSNHLKQIRSSEKNVVLQFEDGNTKNNSQVNGCIVVEILEKTAESMAIARERNNEVVTQSTIDRIIGLLGGGNN